MLSFTDSVTEAFHKQYYRGAERAGGILLDTYWMGVRVVKCPFDLWNYQEIIFQLRPDLIIETGTFNGGSALFLAHLADLLGKGEVVTVDVVQAANLPRHPRITYLTGSSTDPAMVEQIKSRARGKASVMVLLDSDHSRGHVLDEMRAYHALVTPGSYLIVEDTNVNGHPVLPAHGPGPYEAVQDFLRENQDFEVDFAREKMLLTMNPCGYLRKKK
jgi:cephalosporin hydroxylase